MALLRSEIDTGKLFERSLSSVWGRNIAPLHFKTERLAKTALRPGDFDKLRLKCPGIWGIFSTPWVSKLTPDGLGLQ